MSRISQAKQARKVGRKEERTIQTEKTVEARPRRCEAAQREVPATWWC